MLVAHLLLMAILTVSSVHGQGSQGGSCIFPFQLAFGTTNTCYFQVPEGEEGDDYCPDLNEVYSTPSRIRYQGGYDICYYVIGFGEGSFPQGCCGGGLPGRR